MKTLFALLLIVSFSSAALANSSLGVRNDVSCAAKNDTEEREAKQVSEAPKVKEVKNDSKVKQD